MPETPRVTSLVLDVPGWAGHRPGQHVDVRLTAEDGYQAERSYSIATPPTASGSCSPWRSSRTARSRPSSPRSCGPATASSCAGRSAATSSGTARPASRSTWSRAARASSRSWPCCATGPRPASTSRRRCSTRRGRSRTSSTGRSSTALAAADPALRVVHTLTRAQPDGWEGYARRIDGEMLAEVFGEDDGGACVRLRPDALRRGGRGRPGRPRLRAGPRPHRAVRRERALSRWRLQT